MDLTRPPARVLLLRAASLLPHRHQGQPRQVRRFRGRKGQARLDLRPHRSRPRFRHLRYHCCWMQLEYGVVFVLRMELLKVQVEQ